jgi:hypothetical protein
MSGWPDTEAGTRMNSSVSAASADATGEADEAGAAA